VKNIMSNSNLVNYTRLSPNNSGIRTHAISRITPHCVVGQLTVENLGNCFASTIRQASCNYGIGTDGKILLCVDEDKRSWCSSSNDNDQRAVTIECASDKTAPYAFNDKVYNSLINLCVDICKRNNKTKLIWIADKNTALKYNLASNEMLLTVHRWFAAKSCPGDWMYNRMGDLAEAVTNKLSGSSVVASTTTSKVSSSVTTASYKVRVTVGSLNIRKGPSTSNPIVGTITDKGVYTIVEEKNGWGLLKSYQTNRNGWISLTYAKKI
jgi:hypothetical protein